MVWKQISQRCCFVCISECIYRKENVNVHTQYISLVYCSPALVGRKKFSLLQYFVIFMKRLGVVT